MPGVKYTVDVEVNGNGKLDQASKSFEKTSQSVQKINQRLKGMQNDLYAMAENGDKSSKAFLNMAKRAGDLKNAMGDTRAIVNYFADGERAVNGMNNAISATTSVVQGLYGTYSLLGGEANDKLLKNMVALESMNARLSNAYNLLKPDGKAMLYMNEMAKKGSIFASVMGKAGSTVFKMIPAFKALSIASFLGEVTGVNDKIKEWITNTDTFKNILSNIGINLPDNVATNQAGQLVNGQSTSILRRISSGTTPEEALLNLSGGAAAEFKKNYPQLFTDEVNDAVKEYKENSDELRKSIDDLTKQITVAERDRNQRRVDELSKLRESNRQELKNISKWQATASGLIAGSNPSPTNKSNKNKKSLKSTRNTGEKLSSNAPQTFNIYIDKMGEIKELNVANADDLDKLGKNIYEVMRRMLVQITAEQANK